MRSARVLAAAGCLLLVGVAGCGGAKPSPARAESSQPDEITLTPDAAGLQSVQIDADDGDRFHPSLVRARPGPVQVTLRHVGTGAPHNWTAKEVPGARIPLVEAGGSGTRRFTVGRPGDYRFVCTIHETQGQVGRLVVGAAP